MPTTLELPIPQETERSTLRLVVHLVASIPARWKGQFRFLAWEGLAPTQQRIFEAAGGTPWWLPELAFEAAQQLIDDYCALTDAITAANDAASIWWYTWSASRDRFHSRILEQMEFLARLTSSVEALPAAEVVLWCPQPQLAIAIHRALCGVGVPVRRDSISQLLWWMRRAVQWFAPWRLGLRAIFRTIADGVALQGWLGLRRPLAPRRRVQLLLVTWLRSADVTDQVSHGTYFGRLPSLAQQRGIQVALFGGLLDRARRPRAASHTSDVIVSVPPAWLQLSDLVRALVVGLFAPIRVPVIGHLRDNAIRALVCHDIRENRGKAVVSCLLLEYGLRRFLQAHAPETIVHICENNPWEKACERAVTGLPQRPEICGYLHCGVVLSHTKYILTACDRQARPRPDRLICTGARPRDIMIRHRGHAPEETVAGCAWRFEHLQHLVPRRGVRWRGNLLVVLEGLSTMVQLMWFMERALAGQTSVKARLRAHPQYPLERLLHEASLSLEGHLTLAPSRHANLLDDLAEADLVVYKGSTAALEAGYLGIPLIHVHTPNILTDDPLFEISDLKSTVTRPEDFLPTVERAVSISEEQFGRSLSALRGYVEAYLTPPSEETLACFLPGRVGHGVN